MTREEKINQLNDIFAEINEDDNAVCYLTSEDNELIESAIKALEQESCEDAISRKEALEALKQEEPLVWCDGADEIAARNQWLSDVDTIKNMPPVQPKIKTGHWIEVEKYSDGKHKIKCSECRSHIIDRGHANSYVVKEKYKYCPRCGAKMVKSNISEILTGLESEDKE